MSEVDRLIDDAGLRREPTEDLTPLALPSMHEWLRFGGPSSAGRRVNGDRDPRRRAALAAHFAAGRACARALIDGDFLYVRYAATAP